MNGIPVYEFVVVAQNVTQSFAVLRHLAANLTARLDTTPLVGADLFFKRETDVALIGLKLDARFTTRSVIAMLTDIVTHSGHAVLEPSKLPAPELRRFREVYLPLYTVAIRDLPSLEDAVRVLGERLGAAASPPPMPQRSVTARPAASATVAPGRSLEVRFRRGDEWQLGRVRTLTHEAIYVSTGGPPRRGDVVDLDLTYDSSRLVTRASVVHVTPAEAAAALGAAGFGARFLGAEGAERQRLQKFLESIRGLVPAGLVPPPRRRDVRYPVRWPVYLGTQGGARSTSALDVSRHGMFIANDGATLPAQGASVELTLPLDDNGAPVRARARVARAITPQVARQRGVTTGVGLEFDPLAQRDENRFLRFLARVGRRAGFSIVVGASVTRSAQICSELIGAGYAASGASDAPTLISKAAAAARAPDLVLIDVSLTRGDVRAENAVRRALATRSVPMLHVDETSPQGARSLADVALLA